MEKRNAPTFTLSIVAIIVGVALYKQFNFETFEFEKKALSALYAVVFIFSMYVLIKSAIEKRKQIKD